MQSMFDAAQAAQKRQDWDAALELWAVVRADEPWRPEGFIRAAIACLSTGDLAEADELLCQAVIRFPGGIETHLMLAKVAQRRADWPVAADRWAGIAARFPNDARGYAGLADALRQLRRVQDAWEILLSAAPRFPHHAELALSLARTASMREDLDEADQRWQVARDLGMDNAAAHLGYVRYLLSRPKPKEAEAALAVMLGRFPPDQEISILQARIATALGHLPAALTLWRAADDATPDIAEIAAGLAETLGLMGDFGAAEAILSAASQRHGLTAPIACVHADLAAQRGDFAGALKRWQEAYDRFPGERRVASGLNALTLRLLADPSDDAKAPASGEPHRPAPMPDEATLRDPEKIRLRPIIADFESLGDTCEFGNVQREFGLEPLGLLRWTSIPMAALTDAVNRHFEGVGDPAQTAMGTLFGEHMTSDTVFTMRMHSFIKTNEVTAEELLPKLCERLRFLRRKFLEDLAEGRKIFVYKATEFCTDRDVEQLHEALRGHHRENRLLVVKERDAEHPANSLRALGPNLLIGYIESFNVTHPWTPGWSHLCAVTHAHLLVAPDFE